MKRGSYLTRGFRKLSEVGKGRLHLFLLSSFLIPIMLILFLDFLNIEAFDSFNQKFMFDLTWKGRMFYLFFIWLLLLESILDWEVIVEKQRTFQNRFRILLTCVFAAVPTLYVLSVNFLSLNQIVINVGQALQIRPGFINEPWPLSVEYLVLVSLFIFATWSAYGFTGLKSLSISLSLLAGIGIIYLVDTIWPYGTFKPMQLFAVPTAACATALMDLLGYDVRMAYSSLAFSPEFGAMPAITVIAHTELPISRYIGWPCAGVHSLLLFTLITLVFFKKTTMQRDRKIIFFFIGTTGTYLTNIFRISLFFTISINYGEKAGNTFHDSYGELCFIAWMLIYFAIIVAIQSGKINRFTRTLRQKLKTFGFGSAD